MVVSTTGTALPVFRAEGISFVTSTDWDPSDGQFGALAFIYGTIVTSVIALVIAVPLSLGVALFLTEYSPKRLRGPITYAVDLLAAVPSVIYGLWGVFVLLPLFLQPAADFFAKYLGFIPIFAGPGLRPVVLRRRGHPGHHDHPHHHARSPVRSSPPSPAPTGRPPTPWGPPAGR